MSDKDIERAVAPFWRCPNCGSAGTPYVADLDALRAEVARLRDGLIRIRNLGHSSHHGRGYTLADIADRALARLNEVKP